MARIETRTGIDGKTYFCIVTDSPVVSSGIIVAEHLTKEAAEADLKFWV